MGLIAGHDQCVELRQLVYFEAVVRCGGFTRAAESLRIAQPAISVQVQRLEQELGTVLLTRTTRRVTLTAAGELFLVRARRVLGELDAARHELGELAAVLRGQVTLGVTPLLGSLDLPRALAGFHARYPGVRLVLRTGLVAELLALLGSGELDLVLGPVHPDLSPRYAAQALVEEQLVLITPPRHPLSRAESVGFTQLRDEPFVCLPPGSGLRSILVAAAAAEDVEPRIQLEAATPASIRELVAAGLGVALLARSTAYAPGPPVAVIAFATPPRHPPIGLVHRRDLTLTPSAEACRRHLVEDLQAAAAAEATAQAPV